jgi:hypothetical protein
MLSQISCIGTSIRLIWRLLGCNRSLSYVIEILDFHYILVCDPIGIDLAAPQRSAPWKCTIPSSRRASHSHQNQKMNERVLRRRLFGLHPLWHPPYWCSPPRRASKSHPMLNFFGVLTSLPALFDSKFRSDLFLPRISTCTQYRGYHEQEAWMSAPHRYGIGTSADGF